MRTNFLSLGHNAILQSFTTSPAFSSWAHLSKYLSLPHTSEMPRFIALCGSWGNQERNCDFLKIIKVFWGKKKSGFPLFGRKNLLLFPISNVFMYICHRNDTNCFFLLEREAMEQRDRVSAYPHVELNCLLCIRKKPAGFETCNADATV